MSVLRDCLPDIAPRDTVATVPAVPPPREALARVAAGQGRLTLAGRVLAYGLLVVVMGSVAAMSWSGEYGFAVTQLHWSHGHAALVPVSLDIAAMSCALLALDSIGDGEPGTTFRLLAAAFVALAAFVNWRSALASRNLAEEVFFPAMSVLAYLIVHAVMDKARRKVRRAHHGQGARTLPPLPRTGILAWVPGIGYPRDALATIRASVRKRLRDEERREDVNPADAPAQPAGSPPPLASGPALPAPAPAALKAAPFRPGGGKVQGPTLAEAALFFKDLLDAGQLPTQQAIRQEWHVGSAKAKGLLESLEEQARRKRAA